MSARYIVVRANATRLAFGSATKAVGFTVLLEGVLLAAHTPRGTP